MKTLIFYSFLIVFYFSSCSHQEKKEVVENPSVTLTRAYTFGFPLVLMDITREIQTNVTDRNETLGRAPINQFSHAKSVPDANFRDVIRPNLDTLYSTAWLDLDHGPMVLELPDTNRRYYLMPMLDAWTNVYASPGKRTTGTKAQKYVIAGPNWQGDIPAGHKLIRSPTSLTWIIGRIQMNSAEDAKTTVARLQKGVKLYPLGKDRNYVPPKNKVNKNIVNIDPLTKIYSLSTEDFFNRLNKLMQKNPPSEADRPSVDAFAKLGVAPGEYFNMSKFSDAEKERIANIPQERKDYFTKNFSRLGVERNHWLMPNLAMGDYKTDYDLRAIVAHQGLGANLVDDAIYPTAVVDSFGQELTGNKSYMIHFDKDQLPPVNAFWSLTIYGQDGFFVKNPMNRYALGDRNKLVYNDDGSLDIYLQRQSPGKNKEANWLPTPDGSFNVVARYYWPTDKALNPKYVMPPIMPFSEGAPISYYFLIPHF